MDRPAIFIGSSSEGEFIAATLAQQLEKCAETTLWAEGVFGLGKGNLENLVDSLGTFDFGVLVLTPDDIAESRGRRENSPRDNVLLECGLFMGGLGGSARSWYLTVPPI